MNKLDVLRTISIGSSIAEQEIEGLKDYFFKTNIWNQLESGEIDIVFGSKGSGKSAIYNSLSNNSESYFDMNAILALAENPRGTIAFKDLSTTPPQTEYEFKFIWKLYFVLIAVHQLQEYASSDNDFKVIVEKLQEADLLPRRITISSMVRATRDYINKVIHAASLEPNIELNEYSGMIEKIGLKISLAEPSSKHSDIGVVSVDYLLELVNNVLEREGFSLWLAIDRLDAIFQENLDLEAMALRTLFQVYIDFQGYEKLRLIIFCRDDIWNRIIDKGFREASHLVKQESLSWDNSQLFELLISRVARNKQLLAYFNIDYPLTHAHKTAFMSKIFPEKQSGQQEYSFDWLVPKLKDGNGNVTPRDLIQVIHTAIKYEIKLLMEEKEDRGNFLNSSSLYDAIRDVSKTKLEVFHAEYPALKYYTNRLKNKNNRIRFQLEELKEIWEVSKKGAQTISRNLLKLGFFKNEGTEEKPTFLIPIIYRPCLGIKLPI